MGADLIVLQVLTEKYLDTFMMAETDLKTQEGQAQNGKSPEASPEKKNGDSVDGKAKGMMCLVTGKRHLICQDISSAVESLGEACELLAQEFGDKAPECAEAYFYYGKALLEAARLEAGVLGNIDTDDSEEKSEDDEDDEEQGGDTEEGDINPDDNAVDEENNQEEAESGEAATSAEPEKEKEEIAGDGKETQDAAEQEVEDEEDPSNLQLAWEMLELAKMVLTEQLEGENKAGLTEEARTSLEKRLFETFLILGEVSLENENYPQAVEDLSICLEKQKAVLPEDSRNIAVTYYQLGIAQGFNMKYEEAVDTLGLAIAVLKKRIDNLAKKTESVDESKKDDVFYTREKEMAELESLIPEIKEKITDTIEMKEESLRKIAEVKEQIGFGSSSSGDASSSSAGSSKPISSISIKRKAETSTESEKKVRTEAEVLKDNGQ